MSSTNTATIPINDSLNSGKDSTLLRGTFPIDVNLIPFNSQAKVPLKGISWKEYQNKPIPDEIKRKWIGENLYDYGRALYTGKIWNGPFKGKYLVCIDLDNELAMKEFIDYSSNLFSVNSLEELSEKTIVEQHRDAKYKRAHIYVITDSQIKKRGRISNKPDDDEIPQLEVKSDSTTVVICSPSIHKNGFPYEIVGTFKPHVLDTKESKKLDSLLDQLYSKYDNKSSHTKNSLHSNLPNELKEIAQSLHIGNCKFIIKEGTRDAMLLSFANSMLSRHRNSEVGKLKDLLYKVNQSLCDKPLSDNQVERIWNQVSKYLTNRKKHRDEENEKDQPSDSKREFFTYKYTSNKHVYEAILVGHKPYFVTHIDGQIELVEQIEQDTRILKPPHEEDYVYAPLSFEDEIELENFVAMSKTLKIDMLFTKTNEMVSKFIVHHKHVIDYFSALILFSYFQDKYPTVPYTMFVADNGSGKSSVGDLFEMLGYRCVNMTDPTTANVYRIFGNIETGQCTLVLDEAEKIDSNEIMSILKSGYERGKIITRTNNQTGKQEHFHAFGLKIMLAERTPHPSKAKGVLDRTFINSNFKGKPELDIKEIKNAEHGRQLKVKQELEFLRKSLLIYRIVHFNDAIIDINIGLEGRDKELCKPLLQVFYGNRSLGKIERALEKLVDEKHERKANSLEREALEVIVNLFEEHTDGLIPFRSIWDSLAERIGGHINQYKNNEMETEIYGTIYKATLSKMLRDRFGAKDPISRKASERYLVFDLNKTRSYLDSYARENNVTRISCSVIEDDSSDSSDSKSESLFDTFWNASYNKISENIPIDQTSVSIQKEEPTTKMVNIDKREKDADLDSLDGYFWAKFDELERKSNKLHKKYKVIGHTKLKNSLNYNPPKKAIESIKDLGAYLINRYLKKGLLIEVNNCYYRADSIATTI
jgi:hypothetical protein